MQLLGSHAELQQLVQGADLWLVWVGGSRAGMQLLGNHAEAAAAGAGRRPVGRVGGRLQGRHADEAHPARRLGHPRYPPAAQHAAVRVAGLCLLRQPEATAAVTTSSASIRPSWIASDLSTMVRIPQTAPQPLVHNLEPAAASWPLLLVTARAVGAAITRHAHCVQRCCTLGAGVSPALLAGADQPSGGPGRGEGVPRELPRPRQPAPARQPPGGRGPQQRLGRPPAWLLRWAARVQDVSLRTPGATAPQLRNFPDNSVGSSNLGSSNLGMEGVMPFRLAMEGFAKSSYTSAASREHRHPPPPEAGASPLLYAVRLPAAEQQGLRPLCDKPAFPSCIWLHITLLPCWPPSSAVHPVHGGARHGAMPGCRWQGPIPRLAGLDHAAVRGLHPQAYAS